MPKTHCGKRYIRWAMSVPAAMGALAATASPSHADWVDDWLAMATRTQDQQPHWMTPVDTTTPRLEQEFRYDMYWESLPGHGWLNNQGAGKGLEIIPAEKFEVILGIPPLEMQSGPPQTNGWANWPMFLVKYRILSANEQEGNYILSAFFQVIAPFGSMADPTNVWIAQPYLAFGKGFGDFDIQGTVSAEIPFGGTDAENTNFGHRIFTNVTFQYHFLEYFWPEVELNDIYFVDGGHQGQNRLWITPGIIFGRFPIHDRVKLNIGVGYQIKASEKDNYDSNWILTTRLTF
jgi:hypothetical protein